MRQVERFGIEIDVCPTTGGVWLDKGELEKLISLIKEEARDDRGKFRGRDEDFIPDDDDYGHDRGPRRIGGGRRSRLSDIFDF